MAPTLCKVIKTASDKTKLRKPVVEKMRRDRINRCIEQLKVLLKAQIKASQPCSKLEKADVLEMAVVYLKNNTASPHTDAHAQSYTHGFSRCVEETARFLSLHSQQQQTTKPVSTGQLDRSQQPKSVCAPVRKHSCQTSGEQALWRPW